MREFANPDELLGTLRQVDVTPLLPKLGADAQARIDSGSLTVAEILVAAEWLGMERPEDVFRGM